jgi:antitoxin (DNA-binding transcriptional repressor) of toxin-antitoxin stability system
MTVVSTSDFRKNAKAILGRVLQGQRVVLTYRGKAVARLDPVRESPALDDPFYALADLAAIDCGSLTNPGIDEIVYGA